MKDNEKNRLIILADKKLKELDEEFDKITNYKDIKKQVNDHINNENVDKIKELLNSKYHKIILRQLFEVYNLYESKVSFLFNRFDHSFHFSPSINPQEENIFNEFLSKLIKVTEHKAMHHIPDSEWYEKRKSIKEQGESNW